MRAFVVRCLCWLVVWLVVLAEVSESDCFDYPDNIPVALTAHVSLLRTLGPSITLHETPIQIYLTALYDSLGWQCIAHYSSDTFDLFTESRPVVADDIPSQYHTTETRFLCTAHAFQLFIREFMPASASLTEEVFDGWTLDYLDLDTDIAACQLIDDETDRNQCLLDTAAANNYCPHTIASIIVSNIIQRSITEDGWNRNGNQTPYGECTANCRAYRDFTMFSETYDGNAQKSWQPLVEDDGYGFFYKQEHVTPHIGFTGKPFGITQEWLEESSVENPRYNYKKESDLVIQRMTELENNDERKAMIEFFDDKGPVFGTISRSIVAGSDINWEEWQFFLAGATAATLDSTLLSWRSKIDWSLIRPTTYIKRWGDTKIETWAGPYQGTQEISAADFEAYIRVMPHAEYPSASGCICQALTDFAQLFVENIVGDESLPISVTVRAESSRVEPGFTPATDITVDFSDLKEYNLMCGDSRLWGGMHFTASVAAGQKLASGVGQAVFQKMQSLNPTFL